MINIPKSRTEIQALAYELLKIEVESRKRGGNKEVAKELGCSPATVSRYLREDEIRPITEPLLSKIIKRYGKLEMKDLAELLKAFADKPAVLPALLEIQKSTNPTLQSMVENVILTSAETLRKK